MRKRGEEVKGKKNKDKPCNIYIIAEGCTEKIYLKHYDNRKKGIFVIPLETDHTDAVGIVKYAKEFIDRNDVDIELGDRCYCVFDSDPISNPNIKQAIDLVRGYKHKGLECIFSNPCFEIWFVMHFRKPPFGKTAQEIKKLIKSLVKKDIPNYSETTDIFDLILDKRENAIQESIILHREQSKAHGDLFSHECNPYSNVFEFVHYLSEIKKDNSKL